MDSISPRDALLDGISNSDIDLIFLLSNFPVFASRQDVSRFLALYEAYLDSMEVKGSIVECGVRNGFSLFSFLHFSSISHPLDYKQEVFGFDTFTGFPLEQVQDFERSAAEGSNYFSSIGGVFETLLEVSRLQNDNLLLHERKKLHLIQGDIKETLPRFLEENQHLTISLLMLDLDLETPTRIALELLAPRLLKGSVVIFDEFNDRGWPGETKAFREFFVSKNYQVKRSRIDPSVSWLVV